MNGIIEVYNADTQKLEELELVPTPEISEPNSDGKTYGRKAGEWVEVTPPKDPEFDDKTYGRKNGTWVEIPKVDTSKLATKEEVGEKGDKVDEVVVGGTNVTQTLQSNKLYKFGTLTDLNITLGTPISGIANVYSCQFTSGGTATRLVVPSTIVWAETKATDKGKPKISANKRYEISIINNNGIIGEF